MKFEQREYQARIVEKTLKFFEQHSSVMLQSPTGSGKTVMGGSILGELDLPVVWVTMRRNLLTQAEATMRDLGVTTKVHYDTIFSRNVPRAAVLVVDEAQHDATESMNFIYKTVKPKYVLGMTATPYRTDKLTLCFEKVVSDIGIQQLIRLGYLSPFEHYNIPSWEPDVVVKHYLMDPKGYGQSVMFFHRLDQCQAALMQLRAAKVRCDIVTASTDREAQLRAFEEGKLDVLLNMMVLTEGFDYPNLRSVFVRDSQKLPTTQMAGRVLRIPTDGDATPKRVVQSGQTNFPFTRLATPVRQLHWDQDRWLSLTPNDEGMNRIAMQAAKHIMRLPSPIIPKKQPKFK